MRRRAGFPGRALPVSAGSRVAERADSLTRVEPFAAPRHGGRTVLLIDDDASVRDPCARALQREGFLVESASSGADGLALAYAADIDLVLLDQRLPDMAGIEVIRALQRRMGRVRFVLASGCLTVDVAVRAMKLGAADVIEKPASVDHIVRSVAAAFDAADLLDRRLPGSWLASAMVPRPRRLPQPRPKSAAERWALQVLKACESDGDLKTLDDWATFTGVSYSSLGEICRVIGIRPHDARDLARVLSALMKAWKLRCPVDVLLDVSDRRTLRTLLDKAGIPWGSGVREISVEAFLSHQRFVAVDNEGLRVLRGLVAVREI